MRTNRTWLVLLGALSTFACGSDQHPPSTGNQDGSTAPGDSALLKDLPAPDAAFATDKEGDRVPQTPDTNRDLPLDIAPDERPPTDIVDMALEGATDHPAPLDTAIDTAIEAGVKDAHDAAPTADTAPDTATVTTFPCRTDSDCCIAIDGCMAVAYLYSKGPDGAGPPSLPTHNLGDMCLACIPPAVQVRCVSKQCVGEKISTYSSQLTKDHCGYVNLPDGGLYALYETIDGGSPAPVRTTWSCGS